MEAVDDAPGDVAPEFLHAGAPQEIEDGADDHLHGPARGVRVGHFRRHGFIVDRELAHTVLFAKGCIETRGFDLFTVECAKIGKVGDSVLHNDLLVSNSSSSAMTAGHSASCVQQVRDVNREAGRNVAAKSGNRFLASALQSPRQGRTPVNAAIAGRGGADFVGATGTRKIGGTAHP